MKWRRIRRGYCLLEYASISNTNLHSFVDAAVATPAHGNTHDPLVPYASFRVFLCSTTNRRDDRCFQSLLSFYSNRTENKTNEGGTQVPETYTAATKITTCLQLGELPSYHRIRNSNRRLGIVLPYTESHAAEGQCSGVFPGPSGPCGRQSDLRKEKIPHPQAYAPRSSTKMNQPRRPSPIRWYYVL